MREPIVVTLDGFILSGHRRRCAALVAGVPTVPVRHESVRRKGKNGLVNPAFVVLLREHNRQRDKSLDEKLREELVTVSPADAYSALLRHRAAQTWASETWDADTIDIRGVTRRAEITDAKEPFLQAILAVIEAQRNFLPLSDRRIHYWLLNDPPLRHAQKPDSRYRNDKKSYKSLVELLTRARLSGRIPMHVISDDTRPHETWDATTTPGPSCGANST